MDAGRGVFLEDHDRRGRSVHYVGLCWIAMGLDYVSARVLQHLTSDIIIQDQ